MTNEGGAVLAPDVRTEEGELRPVATRFGGLVDRYKRIDSEELYLESGEVLQQCADYVGRVEDPESKLQRAKKAAHEAWSGLCSVIADLKAPADQLMRVIKPARLAYEREVERARAAEAEKARRAEEARLEQQRRDAAALAAVDAWELEEQGAPADVVELARTMPAATVPAFAPAPILPRASFVPKQAGIGSREKWTADVIDLELQKQGDEIAARRAALMALAAAVVKGDAPLEAIEPNMSFIRNQAKQYKSSLKWPGVVVWDEGTVAVRRK